MKSLSEITSTLAQHKVRLMKKYGLTKLAVFGSFARQEQTDNSDVDIMVDFEKPVGVEFIDLANELEKILKSRIDLVSKNGIRKQYFKAIEPDLNYV